MKRDIHAATLLALRKPGHHPIIMVYLDWPGEALRMHSGRGPITWGGNTWLGVGAFGEIEIPGETPGLVAANASLSLLGAPDVIFDMLETPIRNRTGEVYVALTTRRAGRILIGEPISLFSGYMDAMRYVLRDDDGNKTSAVQIDLASGPGARSASAVFHSYEAQMRDYPGDTAGRFTINAEAEAENMDW